MQHPSDLERKILQQHLELQELAQSLQALSGNSGYRSGPVESAVAMPPGSDIFQSGVNQPMMMFNSHQQPFTAAHAPAYPSRQGDQRVNPNIVDELALLQSVTFGSHLTSTEPVPFRSSPVFNTFHTNPIQGGYQISPTIMAPQHFDSRISDDAHHCRLQKVEDNRKWISAKKVSALGTDSDRASSFFSASLPLSATTQDDAFALPFQGNIGPSGNGQSHYNEYDVLSGRGGRINVHTGNHYFRNLVNMHRISYLRSHKNEKPAISRAIVRVIRDKGGKFLKKCEITGLWYEIGDDAAREKTSQALRQRAPEIRKSLLQTEPGEAIEHQATIRRISNVECKQPPTHQGSLPASITGIADRGAAQQEPCMDSMIYSMTMQIQAEMPSTPHSSSVNVGPSSNPSQNPGKTDDDDDDNDPKPLTLESYLSNQPRNT